MGMGVVDSRVVKVLVVIIGACSVLAQETCDAHSDRTFVEIPLPLVPAMYVFGDSVLDVGTNSLFPSLLQANFEPYGNQYFHRPSGRFTNGQNYADIFAQRIGLPSPWPYLERADIHSIVRGVNYASAGSGILQTTNAENKVIPFPLQFLQFAETKISILRHRSASATEDLFSKSLFLINIGGNDLVTYLFSLALPLDEFLINLMDVIEESVGTVYKVGGRKFMLLGLGPVGCVPGVLVSSGVTDGKCLESVNNMTKAFNGALEELVLSRLPTVFKGIKAIVGKPFETFNQIANNGTAYGFTAGVNACCGSGLYNAEFQCGRPSNLIKNPPYNLCDNVNEFLFWDYFHPTERAYSLFASKLWDGGLDSVAPMNLKALLAL